MKYTEFASDPDLLADWFRGPSWDSWRAIDKAIFGEPMDQQDRATFHQLTGREQPPTAPATEVWLALGRRSGKSLKAASYATFIITEGNRRHRYRRFMVPGERGVVQVIAVDREQCGIVFGYLEAMFTEKPALAKLLARPPTADTIELRGGLAIEVTTNDKRRVRGRTVIAAIFEEFAHWRSENSVTPDRDVYRAVKPAMATIPNALLIGISSPYARRGLFWDKYKAHYGKDGPALVAQADTATMNPSIDRAVITEAYEEDEAAASAEFGALFRTDVEAFVSREVIDSCTSTGTRERPPVPGVRYVAFVDPSGGSSDSFTCAIAHGEVAPSGVTEAILDAVREQRPPFSPAETIAAFCALLREYRISSVTGDKYAGEFPRELFRGHGIAYRTSDKTKSDIYKELLPLLNSGRADLLDDRRLANQLLGLERRTARGGRDSIDHGPNAHDDVANAAAGALTLAAGTMRRGGLGCCGRTHLPHRGCTASRSSCGNSCLGCRYAAVLPTSHTFLW